MQKKRLNIFFFILLCAFMVVPSCRAIEVTLKWDSNAESDLAGYRLFYKARSSTQGFDYLDPVFEGNETTCTINVPEDGYFVIRAFDHTGNESKDSEALFLDTPPEKPEGLLIESYEKLESAISILKKVHHAPKSSDPRDLLIEAHEKLKTAMKLMEEAYYENIEKALKLTEDSYNMLK